MRRKRETGAYLTFIDYTIIYAIIILMWCQLVTEYSD